jgi:Lon protease-like protein
VSAERHAPRIERAALAQACVALKVFPLPGVVLLPGAPAPFHVFEPRYRALFEAAITGDRVVAVPTIVDPEEAMTERPRLLPVAGVCVIVGEQRNDDGTRDVLLHCAGRVRLVEEVTRRTAWREFRAAMVEDAYPPGGAAALQGDVEALGQLCYDLIPLLPPESGVARLTEAVARMKDPAAMADLVAAQAGGRGAGVAGAPALAGARLAQLRRRRAKSAQAAPTAGRCRGR